MMYHCVFCGSRLCSNDCQTGPEADAYWDNLIPLDEEDDRDEENGQ